MAHVGTALNFISACYARTWTHTPLNWINVKDPLYFLGYGIPRIYVKRILFSF